MVVSCKMRVTVALGETLSFESVTSVVVDQATSSVVMCGGRVMTVLEGRGQSGRTRTQGASQFMAGLSSSQTLGST